MAQGLPDETAERAPLHALLFGLRTPVPPRAYWIAGLSLALVKYLLEAGLLYAFDGRLLTPWRFLVPLASVRYPDLAAFPIGLLALLGLLNLPFLWIGATMSMRRALDAGHSPLFGLLFFVPVVNLFVFAWLALAPSEPRVPADPADVGEPSMLSALLAVGITVPPALCVGLLVHLGVWTYTASVFLGVPFVIGVLAGWIHNRQGPRGALSNLGVACTSVLVACGTIAIFALEGIVCLLMAFGPALLVTIPGVFFGAGLASLARPDHLRGTWSFVLLLPALWIDKHVAEPERFAVTTTIEIEAPPERVWPHVIAFPALPRERHWLFRTGIAFPLGATIEGQGVGALRRCEFSTGTFVEPITAWDEPARLAFDVAAQPDPMRELSPWGALRPPHLEHGFRSERGEFRLIALADGRTRLEGTTWYALDLHPSWYWRLVAEPILHRIHLRVLEHVRALAQG